METSLVCEPGSLWLAVTPTHVQSDCNTAVPWRPGRQDLHREYVTDQMVRTKQLWSDMDNLVHSLFRCRQVQIRLQEPEKRDVPHLLFSQLQAGILLCALPVIDIWRPALQI